MTEIEELLNQMQSKYKTIKENTITNPVLNNTKDTWQRIGLKDSFSELEFTSESEKDKFLKEWIESNPYYETI